jgi:hypothetical protein
MELYVAGSAVVALTLLMIALVVEPSRSRVLGADAHRLARLAGLRSPTGKRFYPTGEAPLELSANLDEVTGGGHEAACMRPPARPRPGRGGGREPGRASRFPRRAPSVRSR